MADLKSWKFGEFRVWSFDYSQNSLYSNVVGLPRYLCGASLLSVPWLLCCMVVDVER
jgi:hypothetical protein